MAIKEVLLSAMQESVKKHLDCIERHNEDISKMKNDYMRECRDFEDEEVMMYNGVKSKVIGLYDVDLEDGEIFYTISKSKKDGDFSAKYQRTNKGDKLEKIK